MTVSLDFAVIGAQRAGTTTLADLLRQHPALFLPAVKEVRFFSSEALRQRGPRYLEPYYRAAAVGQRRGLVDGQLLALSDGAWMLHDHHPRARLIAVLRDPVERAHSAYWFARNQGLDPAPRFEDAVAREHTGGGVATEWERAHLTHLAHGRYAAQLRGFLQRFGRTRVHVLLTDDLWDSTRSVARELFRWLGVDDDPPGVRYGLRSNAAARRRSVALQRLLDREGRLKRWYRSAIGDRARVAIRQRVLTPLERLNRAPFEVPPLSPELRAELVAEFEPEIRDLEDLIGRDLSAWLR